MLKTKEQRRRETARIISSKKKEEEVKLKEEEKEQKNYPPFIRTLSQRLKRIDPWHGIASLNPLNSTFITYYKLRQFGLETLKIITTNTHSWVEFNYNDEWWIFDPVSVRLLSLGEPLKRKRFVTEPEYNNVGRTFTDIDDFYQTYEDKLDYNQDEAKIAAMKDQGLSSVLRIKYI